MGLERLAVNGKRHNISLHTLHHIADAKRGDIGNISPSMQSIFEALPLIPSRSLPWGPIVYNLLDYVGKWTIPLGLTSNSGAADLNRSPPAGTGCMKSIDHCCTMGHSG